MSLKIEFTFSESEMKKLEKIPEFVRFVAADRALKAMAKPIIEKAKAIAPSSVRSGSRKKWGPKYKGDSKYQNDSGQEIDSKVQKHNRGAKIYVGATFPRGNKQQFNASPKGRKEVFWGRPQGTVYKPSERFMQRAFDETRSAQNAAFIASLQRTLKRMNLG